jgi:hypothetical protein
VRTVDFVDFDQGFLNFAFFWSVILVVVSNKTTTKTEN